MSIAYARNQKGFSTKLFARRLSVARIARGLTGEQLGRKCSIRASSISKFEHGERMPSIQNLFSLAEALRVSVDYLIGHLMLDPEEPDFWKGMLDNEIESVRCLIEFWKEKHMEPFTS